MIGPNDTPLSKPKEVVTRTNFEPQRKAFWGGKSYGEAETEVINFAQGHKAEFGAFLDNPTFQFFYDWLKESCDYYKDILSVNPDGNKDAKYRGIIAGQREILVMLQFMRSGILKITQEDK